MKETFSKIYTSQNWHRQQKESASGDGSTLEFTKNLRAELPLLFKKFDIKSVFDGACGDFNWMKEVVKETNVEYIGGDIVDEMIQDNRNRHQKGSVRFIVSDITTDPLPDVDLMIARQVLFHLSHKSLDNFFKNFERSNVKYLLTTSHISPQNFNYDIADGSFRYINIFEDPFKFRYRDVLYTIEDYIDPYFPRNMYLFEKKSVQTSFNAV